MKLIIAEKPSVAREISSIVRANVRKNGYLEGAEWIVSWCIGHLVGLANPEVYDEKYKCRNVTDLPIFPTKWETTVLDNTKKQYDILKTLMNRKDISEVVCATDSGREGEHIFRMVYQKVNCKKPVKRLWINSLEKTAIEEGLNNLRDDRELDLLAEGAMARAKADWLVGMNISRLFYSSVGRVQTPTLALIVHREEEIEKFEAEPFYMLEIEGNGVKAITKRFDKKEECEKIQIELKEKEVIVKNVTTKEKKNNPPKLYDLTTLQREANRYFEFTASETLEIAQALYEKKLLTYPRTDSTYLTQEMEESTKTLLHFFVNNKDFSFIPEKVKLDHVEFLIKPEKVNDHHALLPTNNLSFDIYEKLSVNERKIISLVLSRFFQAVSDPEITSITNIELLCGDISFSTNGQVIMENGYKEILTNFLQFWEIKTKEKKESFLPKLEEKSKFHYDFLQIKEGTTSPPSHFTEDSLLSAMEHAGNDMYEIKEIEKKGIGTPATRAGIIEGLVTKKGYLTRDKKTLLPTEKGRNLINILPERVTSPKMTAEWEEKIYKIEIGQNTSSNFLEEIKTFIRTLIAEYDNLTDHEKMSLSLKKDKKVIGSCPRCGKKVVEGKNSFYCEDFLERHNETPKCGFLIKKDNLFFKAKGKTLTSKMLEELLEKGQILVKGFKPKDVNKSSYDAIVKIDDTGKYINFKMEFKK